MKQNPLGATGLMVSEIGFGAFAIGGNSSNNSYGPTDDATSVAAIHTALELGCNFFDTADVYGYGHSEEVLGLALRQVGATNRVVVASKVGGNFTTGRTLMDFSRAYIVSAVESSLRRLGRDYLDLYQLHNPPVDVIESGEVFEALDDLKAAGKIRHGGVSVHTVAEGQSCLASGKAAALQLPYNLFSLLDPEWSLEPLFDRARASRRRLSLRPP
jgi:aryl-alcohol dehydrogenase-like predicted oxidoreductase